MTRCALTCRALFAASLINFASNASATLIDRGSGLIYDDVLDITWLQDASLGPNPFSWYGAVTWADALVFGGFDDWRLPSMDVNGDTAVVNCTGASEMDCRDNELGYMYYQNFGGMFGQDLTGNQGLIQNVQYSYWSGTDWPPYTGAAWFFRFSSGYQGPEEKFYELSAVWAVRDGDVLAAAPEPATIFLLGAGLVGLLGRIRRRR